MHTSAVQEKASREVSGREVRFACHFIRLSYFAVAPNPALTQRTRRSVLVLARSAGGDRVLIQLQPGRRRTEHRKGCADAS